MKKLLLMIFFGVSVAACNAADKAQQEVAISHEQEVTLNCQGAVKKGIDWDALLSVKNLGMVEKISFLSAVVVGSDKVDTKAKAIFLLDGATGVINMAKNKEARTIPNGLRMAQRCLLWLWLVNNKKFLFKWLESPSVGITGLRFFIEPIALGVDIYQWYRNCNKASIS